MAVSSGVNHLDVLNVPAESNVRVNTLILIGQVLSAPKLVITATILIIVWLAVQHLLLRVLVTTLRYTMVTILIWTLLISESLFFQNSHLKFIH